MARNYAFYTNVFYRATVIVYYDRNDRDNKNVHLFGPYSDESQAKAQITREQKWYARHWAGTHPNLEVVGKIEKADLVWHEI